MLVGKIKKDVRKAIRELIAEGLIVELLTKILTESKKVPAELISSTLGSMAKYVDSVEIQPSDKSVVIKFRKEF